MNSPYGKNEEINIFTFQLFLPHYLCSCFYFVKVYNIYIPIVIGLCLLYIYLPLVLLSQFLHFWITSFWFIFGMAEVCHLAIFLLLFIFKRRVYRYCSLNSCHLRMPTSYLLTWLSAILIMPVLSLRIP